MNISDEMVDVVNEKDEVIGQKSKFYCHNSRVWHRGASILFFKDSSFREVFLQKRSATKMKQPSLFCFIGGHVAAGETYYEAGKRELNEEVFHEQELPEEIDLVEMFKMQKTEDDDYEFHIVFRAFYSGTFNLDPEEVESYLFMDINDLTEDVKNNPDKYTNTCKVTLEKYVEKFKKI